MPSHPAGWRSPEEPSHVVTRGTQLTSRLTVRGGIQSLSSLVVTGVTQLLGRHDTKPHEEAGADYDPTTARCLHRQTAIYRATGGETEDDGPPQRNAAYSSYLLPAPVPDPRLAEVWETTQRVIEWAGRHRPNPGRPRRSIMRGQRNR